eukprot:3593645-Amphidinium_carterae.1
MPCGNSGLKCGTTLHTHRCHDSLQKQLRRRVPMGECKVHSSLSTGACEFVAGGNADGWDEKEPCHH